MTFLDTLLFPTELSYGSSGGPRFGNIIQTTPGGRRTVIQRGSEAPLAWQVRFKRLEEYTSQILSLARVTHGALHGFRFLDWNDFSTGDNHTGVVSAADTDHRHELGVGDGTTTRFALAKVYSYSGSTRTRRIRKPMRLAEAQASSNRFLSAITTEAAMHSVFIDGVAETINVDFSIDYEAGEVVFVTAPAVAEVVEWAGYFVVPANFGPRVDEQLALIAQSYSEREFETIDVVEQNQATTQIVPERPPGGASYYAESATATQRLISFADGLLIRINADAAAAAPFPVKLPVEAEWMLGGPLFHIVNEGTVDTINVQRSTGAAIVALAPGYRAAFWLARNLADTDYAWVPV